MASRGNPKKYIRALEQELILTDEWKRGAASQEEKAELDKEWEFFHRLLDAAKRLAKRHGEWQH